MEKDGDKLYLSDNCYIDLEQEMVVKNTLPTPLSRIQFRILRYLVQHMGHPVSSEDLIRYTWGPANLVSKDELYVYINRIRDRIEDDRRNPRYLLSVRGMGYLLHARDE